MAISLDTSNTELLGRALSFVLIDEGFSLPSALATRARKSAERLKEWSNDSGNKHRWREFADELVHNLRECFQTGQLRSVQKRRERMWEQYHKFRCSQQFKTHWSKFLERCIGCEPCPIFIQFINDKIMGMLIKSEFPVEEVQQECKEPSLDYEEKNALRYTAGYTIRALKKKIKRSTHPLKKEIELCLIEMNEEDTEECMDESVEWTRSVDRGGLIHVSDVVYEVFVRMELVLRQYLNGRRACELDQLQQVTQLIVGDEQVLFGWSVVSMSWEEEEASVLLRMIAEHWLNLRGFSLASSLVEKYKQSVKKNVQKSKGIRKQLQGSTAKKGQVPESSVDS